MPYSIDVGTTYIKVTYSGTLDNNDIEGVLKDSLVAYSKEIMPAKRLEDMRKLEGIKIGFNDFMRFTENLRTLQLPHTSRTAVLTGNPLQYGIARMFQTILTHPQMELKVFLDEKEAMTWLSENNERN